MKDLIRKKMTAVGRVQACGFRYFVCMTANRYHITGWVMNCDDGTVDMEAQGTEADLDRFIQDIKKGNGFSRVDKLWIAAKSVKPELGFHPLN